MWLLYCIKQQRWANLAKIGKIRTECSKYGFLIMTGCLLLEGNMGSCTRCVVSVPGNSWNVATDHKTDLLCRGPAPAQVGDTEDCRDITVQHSPTILRSMYIVFTIFRPRAFSFVKGPTPLAPSYGFTPKNLLICYMLNRQK